MVNLLAWVYNLVSSSVSIHGVTIIDKVDEEVMEIKYTPNNEVPERP